MKQYESIRFFLQKKKYSLFESEKLDLSEYQSFFDIQHTILNIYCT